MKGKTNMKVIFGAPGSGKTKAILEESAKNNIPVLCESEARVRRLLEKARGYGFNIPMPITVDELDGTVEKVYIDDIKRVLDVVLNTNLCGVTINSDDDLEVETLK